MIMPNQFSEGDKKIKGTALVVFGESFPRLKSLSVQKFTIVVAPKMFKNHVHTLGYDFAELDTFIDPGSVYEASAMLEELPKISFADGNPVSKSFIYKGYELWWINYNNFFYHFCLPYTQYKRLLEYLKEFQKVTFYRPPNKNLFSCYLYGYWREMKILNESGFKKNTHIPFGIFIQIFVTALSVLVLAFKKCRLLVFIGDKLEKSRDYDFRMKFVYEELRRRDISFVEFIRSLESWKTLLKHVFIRRRPVIYSEAVASMGRFLSIVTGGRRSALRRFGSHIFDSETSPEKRFKLMIVTSYLIRVNDDIWAIQIMKLILRIIEIRVGLFTAALERNFHTVLGCKLNNIPTVGILHGVASRHSTPYDYMTGFDGKKSLSLDVYGVWSEWWRAHYIKESFTYKPAQLHVSGPMRPLVRQIELVEDNRHDYGRIRVLFIGEQTAVPLEVMPYLKKLMNRSDIELTIKFRPFRDGFEDWLLVNEPNILNSKNIKIIKGNMQDAIESNDVVVGCHSTGVLEALLQLRTPIFIYTHKWGDYYRMAESEDRRIFLAENPEELTARIHYAHTIPRKTLLDLQEQYFGDPHKNGSAWAVDKVEQLMSNKIQ